MDITRVEQFIRNLITTHADVFRQIAGRQTATLELSAFLGAKEHYRTQGYATRFRNPRGARFTVKCQTRGHPSKYSSVEVERNGTAFEIHMNLAVRSAHDDGIYCVDGGVAPRGIVPIKVSKQHKWLCLANEDLITFFEAKKLVVYPMLLAQFIGIAHELAPRFVGGRLRPGFIAAGHFSPTLITLGHFSGNSEAIVRNYSNRKIRVNIVTNYDTRLALVRRGGETSPFAVNFFEREQARLPAHDQAVIPDELNF